MWFDGDDDEDDKKKKEETPEESGDPESGNYALPDDVGERVGEPTPPTE